MYTFARGNVKPKIITKTTQIIPSFTTFVKFIVDFGGSVPHLVKNYVNRLKSVTIV